MKKDENLPEKAGVNSYQIMKMDAAEITEILQENLGGESLSISDLTVIKVPGAGGTTWSVPTIDGDKDVKELVGIIVFTKTTRAYWEVSYDDGIPGPPDCMSFDGITGTVGPWGTKDCIECPGNQFQETEDDAGVKAKQCSEKRNIFMVLPDQVFPVVVRAPVMSLKNARKYLIGVSSANQKIHSVYTKLTLEKAENAQKKQYAKIVFTKVGDVEDPEATASYAKMIRPLLDKATRDLAGQAGD
jgi:hypothetical protein